MGTIRSRDILFYTGYLEIRSEHAGYKVARLHKDDDITLLKDKYKDDVTTLLKEKCDTFPKERKNMMEQDLKKFKRLN